MRTLRTSESRKKSEGRRNVSGKCFTYVTKTCAHLSTCSRKPGNYNGTIIFVIDIIKLLPTQFKIHIFCHCQTQNNNSLQCHTHSVLSRVTADTITKKTIKTFVKKSCLTKVLIDWGWLFPDINLKNNGAIVIPRFSSKNMWISAKESWWHRWNIYTYQGTYRGKKKEGNLHLHPFYLDPPRVRGFVKGWLHHTSNLFPIRQDITKVLGTQNVTKSSGSE